MTQRPKRVKSQTLRYTKTNESGDVLLDEKNKKDPATIISKWPEAHHVEKRVYLISHILRCFRWQNWDQFQRPDKGLSSPTK